MFISVLLPLPELPITATSSPRSMRHRDAAQRVTSMSPICVDAADVTHVDHGPVGGLRGGGGLQSRAPDQSPRGRSEGTSPRLRRRHHRRRGGSRRRQSLHRRRSPPPPSSAPPPPPRPPPVLPLVLPATAPVVTIGTCTSSPALSPLRIWVVLSPTMPVMTGCVTVLPPCTSVTVDPAPRREIAELVTFTASSTREIDDRAEAVMPGLSPERELVEAEGHVVAHDPAVGGRQRVDRRRRARPARRPAAR